MMIVQKQSDRRTRQDTRIEPRFDRARFREVRAVRLEHELLRFATFNRHLPEAVGSR